MVEYARSSGRGDTAFSGDGFEVDLRIAKSLVRPSELICWNVRN